MDRITTANLEGALRRLNTIMGRPISAYTKDASGNLKANIGNFHLSGAYGGYSVQLGYARIHSTDSQGSQDGKGNQMKIYTYTINLDERGSFYADVRDANDKTVFEIKAGDELAEDESSIFEDGYMSDKDDMSGLTDYLRDLRVIPQTAVVVQS